MQLTLPNTHQADSILLREVSQLVKILYTGFCISKLRSSTLVIYNRLIRYTNFAFQFP